MTNSPGNIRFLLSAAYILLICGCFSAAANDIKEIPNQNRSDIKDSLKINNNNKLTPEEFMFAGSRLFTLDGTMPNRNTDIKLIPTLTIGAAYAGIFYLQHKVQIETIWKNTGDFHILEDGKYALYSDKAGHFFGTYFTSYLLRESMMMSGLGWESSNIAATLMGLGYTTYVEILDGYAIKWGFSPSDFYFDIAGAAFFLGQHYFPVLQNFSPKFMYFPAEWHGAKSKKGAEFFIDDYSSQTLWLSVNVHNLLPENLKNYWPDWLELSFGYAARNLCAPDPGSGCDLWGNPEPHYDENGYLYVYGDPKFIVALDYNLVKLLPDGGYFWNWLRQTLNFFKLPSPAVEFGEETKFYLIYPFPID